MSLLSFHILAHPPPLLHLAAQTRYRSWDLKIGPLPQSEVAAASSPGVPTLAALALGRFVAQPDLVIDQLPPLEAGQESREGTSYTRMLHRPLAVRVSLDPHRLHRLLPLYSPLHHHCLWSLSSSLILCKHSTPDPLVQHRVQRHQSASQSHRQHPRQHL